MAHWQKILLAVIVIVFGAVMVLFWGSIASALSAFCLLVLGVALLYHHFLIDRGDDDYWGGTEG